nr:MAG TPA: hypothetical protein [Caudoviricetes sp.]
MSRISLQSFYSKKSKIFTQVKMSAYFSAYLA